MQIFPDAIVEEQPKHANSQTSNNNSIPSSINTDSAEHARKHSFTNVLPKSVTAAPLLSTPENRSVNLLYSNGGSVKNGRKRPVKEQVIVLENLNLDSITQSSSSAAFSKKSPPLKNTISRPIFSKPPLQISVERQPPPFATAKTEPASSDSFSSQQQECSSTHSDDNSILSPVEATEYVMRSFHGPKTNEAWNCPELESLRADHPARVTEEKQSPPEESSFDNTLPESTSSAQNTPSVLVDPKNIALNEKADTEQKKVTRPSGTKDPESGLTIDTVKRRRLCTRYGNLLTDRGVVHRLAEIPNLTNIQVAGLLRRSRNRTEMADLSEDVWNFVFEEKRRVEDRSYSENIVTSKEFNKKLTLMKNDDLDEATDLSDLEDYNPEVETGFPFEEVQNLEEEDSGVHELLRKKCEFYETRRYFHETDRWLCLLNRSLMERRSRARQIAEMISKKPTLQFMAPAFEENEDSSQRCARIMPVKVLNRSKIIKPGKSDGKNDILNFVKQTEQLNVLETDLSRCLEDLSLQLQDEDPRILSAIPRSSFLSDKRILENLSEIRRREARDRAKKASERLNNPTYRGVGRPPKRKATSTSDPYKKYLKRKASRDHRERLNSTEVTILQENPSELKSFEEQLRRLSSSKAYVYSEIVVPEYRPFDLGTYIPAEKLVRKISSDLSENQAETPGPRSESNDYRDPTFFARIHHECEFPKLSEEDIRRRRKEKWFIPIPKYVPFSPEKYEHENPGNTVLMYCMTNDKVQPFPPRFHPGVETQPCQTIHREPQFIGINFNKHYKPSYTPNSNNSQQDNS